MVEVFTAHESIDRPASEVWSFLTDFAEAPRWMPGIDRLALMAPGPLAVGSRLSFRARGRAHESEVSALVPGEMIALTSTMGGTTATYTYRLAPVGAGTELTLVAECAAAGPWKFVHPFIVMAMRRTDSRQLEQLVAVITQDRMDDPRAA